MHSWDQHDQFLCLELDRYTSCLTVQLLSQCTELCRQIPARPGLPGCTSRGLMFCGHRIVYRPRGDMSVARKWCYPAPFRQNFDCCLVPIISSPVYLPIFCIKFTNDLLRRAEIRLKKPRASRRCFVTAEPIQCCALAIWGPGGARSRARLRDTTGTQPPRQQYILQP